MKPIIVYRFILFRYSWIGGAVLYPFILFKRAKEEVSDQIFRHELEHVYQIKRLGWMRFYASYLVELVRHGHKNNKYEIAARNAAATPLTDTERALKDNR